MTDIELKELLDKPKWWHHIPILGVMVYAIRFELKLVDLPSAKRKDIKHFRGIFNLVSMAIGVIFLVLTFTLRDKYGFGHFPWIFWLGLSIGLLANVTLYLPKLLYKKGFKRYEENQKAAKEEVVEGPNIQEKIEAEIKLQEAKKPVPKKTTPTKKVTPKSNKEKQS